MIICFYLYFYIRKGCLQLRTAISRAPVIVMNATANIILKMLTTVLLSKNCMRNISTVPNTMKPTLKAFATSHASLDHCVEKVNATLNISAMPTLGAK